VFQATGLFCPVASDADLCGTLYTMTETNHSVNVTSIVTHIHLVGSWCVLSSTWVLYG